MGPPRRLQQPESSHPEGENWVLVTEHLPKAGVGGGGAQKQSKEVQGEGVQHRSYCLQSPNTKTPVVTALLAWGGGWLKMGHTPV